jgi:DNA-binding MarR family transcriptional regulator
MTTPTILTRTIGQTERSMRRLLDRKLAAAGLSFPEWTTLVAVESAPLTAEEIADRQLAGRAVDDRREALAIVEGLAARGLVGVEEAPDDHARYVLTARGRAVYEPLRDAVAHTVQSLFADLPSEDLDVVDRTLGEIMRRAVEQLS